jgi:hypothetical protein
MPHSAESPAAVAVAPGRHSVFGVLEPCAEPAQLAGATLGVGRLFAAAAAAVPETLPQLPLRRLPSRPARRWLRARIARAVQWRPRVRSAHICLVGALFLAALVAALELSPEEASTASRDAARTHANAIKRARPSQRLRSRGPREPQRSDKRDRFDAPKVSPRARTPRMRAVPSASRPARRLSTRAPSPPPPAPRAPALPAPVPAGAPPEFP